MSLDLYIESKTPIRHRNSGIYIRDEGETRILESKEEVLKYFPNINSDEINITSYEDNIYFHMNLTHNLTEMASKCNIIGLCNHNSNEDSTVISLYDLLWHPKDNLNIEVPSFNYLEDIIACYRKLSENANFFKQYNPINGWGTYEQLVRRTKNYINALIKISDSFENYKIETSV